MAIPPVRARSDTVPLMREPDDQQRPTSPAGTSPLHVVYISGGTDIKRTIAGMEGILSKHGLRYASVIADDSLGDTPSARKLAFLERIRNLHVNGQIGPDTRILVQMHGCASDDGFVLEATNVIDVLPWNEFSEALRHPTSDKHWEGDVIVGSCEAGLLADMLPTDEGGYMLLSGKKSVTFAQITYQLEPLLEYMGAHVRKAGQMPSSDNTWKFLTQVTGENIRRVDKKGRTRIKAGKARRQKLKLGKGSKRALTKARALQPVLQLAAKVTHGSAASVAALLAGSDSSSLLTEPLLDHSPPLRWMLRAERDIDDKVSLLFNAGFTTIHANNTTVLHEAVMNDRLDVLQALLAREIDVDTPDAQGRTALHVAAAEGKEAMIRLLVSHGANTKAVDKQGKTAFRHAEHFGHLRMLRLLV